MICVLWNREPYIIAQRYYYKIIIKNKVKDKDFRKILFFSFENKKKRNNNGTFIENFKLHPFGKLKNYTQINLNI